VFRVERKPRGGYFRKRLAEDWLRETLAEAHPGALPGPVRSGATFATRRAEWPITNRDPGTGL
jgi:hypothetical protein